MKRKTIFMETTEITSEKTVSEIEQVLSRYNVTAIVKEYEKGDVKAVSFCVHVNGQDLPFRLPCRWTAIQQALAAGRRDFKQAWSEEQTARILTALEPQAKRVAWRQILRWIQAQLALVETEMVKIEEVFMPYMQVRGGQTLFEVAQEKRFLLEGPTQ